MRKTCTILAALLMAGATFPAFADDNYAAEMSAPDVIGIQRKVAPNEVTLNGKTLFVVPVGSGTLSAADRADIIRERLEDIAAHYVASNAVTVSQGGEDTFVVAVAGESVATVEPRLAEAAGADSAKALALVWAKSVRESLAKPAVRVSVR
ncbi:MAG: hypothetical protein H7Y38_01845 [Armatimonadetes bacterium]|nr:hypothetical protein [Armatimonadota bacterium]